MRKFCLIIGIILVAAPQLVAAHGGAYIISELREPYHVLAALAPSPVVVGTGDLSVIIFQAETAAVATVDTVRIEAISPDGRSQWYETEFDPVANSYDQHIIDLHSTGEWRFAVEITDNGSTERFTGAVAVGGTELQLLSLLAYILPLVLLAALISVAALRNRLTAAEDEASEAGEEHAA